MSRKVALIFNGKMGNTLVISFISFLVFTVFFSLDKNQSKDELKNPSPPLENLPLYSGHSTAKKITLDNYLNSNVDNNIVTPSEVYEQIVRPEIDIKKEGFEEPVEQEVLPAKENTSPQNLDTISAFDEEYRYIALFSEQESLANYALKSSECEMGMCKVVVALDEGQTRDALTQVVANALLQENKSFGLTLPLNPNEGESVLYITSSLSLLKE